MKKLAWAKARRIWRAGRFAMASRKRWLIRAQARPWRIAGRPLTRKNIVPADSIGGGRALTELERELRTVVETWLRNKGEKAGVAKEKAMDADALANEIGAIWEKAGKGVAADVAKRHLDFWTNAAQKRVDDNKALGGEI